MARYNCIYSLNRKSPVEAWHQEETGMKVRLTIGDPQLRVEGVEAGSPEEAFASVREAAERFLDGVSRDCEDADLAIVSDEMDVEELDDEGKVRVRAITVTDTCTATFGVQVVHKEADGTIIWEYDSTRPGPIPLPTSDAPRYFRKARTSSDVFDKFRNYFFVLEYVGSRLWDDLTRPKPKGYGGDQGIIRYALEQAFPDQPERLKEAARMVPGIDSALNVYQEVAELLWRKYRTELQHAKYRRGRVPLRHEDEQAVREVLPLVQLIARLLLKVEKDKYGP